METISIKKIIIKFQKANKRASPVSKTPEQRAKAKQALDELFAMGRPAKHEISLNGCKEVAQAMRRKYESLS